MISAPPPVVPVATGTQDPMPIVVTQDASNPRMGPGLRLRTERRGDFFQQLNDPSQPKDVTVVELYVIIQSASFPRGLGPARLSGCSAVASALRSGRRGRWFESTHPDHFSSPRPHGIYSVASSGLLHNTSATTPPPSLAALCVIIVPLLGRTTGCRSSSCPNQQNRGATCHSEAMTGLP